MNWLTSLFAAMGFRKQSSENPSENLPQKKRGKIFWIGLALSLIVGSQAYPMYAAPEAYGFSWEFFSPQTSLVKYQKACKIDSPDRINDPDAQPLLTGKQTLSYRATRIFGYEYHELSTVEIETYVDIKGSPLTLVGTVVSDPSKGWSLQIPMGERYSKKISPADRLIVMLGSEEKKIIVEIPFSDFCK